MRILRTIAALGALSAAMAVPAGPAWAGPAAAPPAAAAATAGYAVGGRDFSAVDTQVTLPQASRFAGYLGTMGASIQLLDARRIYDLTVTACTDATCRPGGQPASRSYQAVLSVYSRATDSLVCSSAAAGAQQCPSTTASFSAHRFAPGQVISLSLTYTVPWDAVMASAGDQNDSFFVGNPRSSPAIQFTNARIGVQLAGTPWTAPVLRAPAAPVKLMYFDRPPPPPDAAEIVTLSGQSGGIGAPGWSHRPLATAPGRAYASPGGLWDQGYGETISLRP